MKWYQHIRHLHYLTEAGLWLAALALLAFMDPDGTHLFSLCPYSWFIESGCFGCGLGHSISYLFRGDWEASWKEHPLALPAILLMLWRCWKLLRWQKNHFKTLTLHN
ncbi:DUF2752 domain-containing protein [Pontibacter sp. H249]|uniref:DUF2752 domain-containing protein n=1 Tax=Pontibacter sp. H249 TaxID=3133420 RepID=UPI0030BA4B0E